MQVRTGIEHKLSNDAMQGYMDRNMKEKYGTPWFLL